MRVVCPQVISSAIGNEPPPGGVLTALETTSVATTTMVVRHNTSLAVSVWRDLAWLGMFLLLANSLRGRCIPLTCLHVPVATTPKLLKAQRQA